ncbi:MAG: small multi-drug export protein [Oscillospiraceae bacterium]|jgi:uncharacterized membrane protein|nr:small multi-drug export protein [Oscillospiraceae bacterium]
MIFYQTIAAHWKDLLTAFGISMVPVFELRGGIVYAAVRGVPFALAFAVCLLGNLLPVPFILLFLRRVFHFLERFGPTARIVKGMERRARRQGKKLEKWKLFGLFVLVAIPLPGTGAWTGALVAEVFDIRMKKALPVIALGVLTAGLIMVILSYLIPGLFFSALR